MQQSAKKILKTVLMKMRLNLRIQILKLEGERSLLKRKINNYGTQQSLLNTQTQLKIVIVLIPHVLILRVIIKNIFMYKFSLV